MDNNTEIKVSVIMPIYNAYKFLPSALDSVLKQTLREIEIICIDDGSTDKSLEILKEYQKKDDRIRIVTETNAGPAHARNKGIGRARGEYVAFLDADDFFATKLLQTLYDVAKRDDLDIAIADYDVFYNHKEKYEKAPENEHGDIYENGKVTSKSEHPNEIFLSTTGSAWNKLFRRSFIVEKNLQFLPGVKMFEDEYFVVCALSLAERVGKISRVLLHHRVHSSQARVRAFRKYYAQVPLVYGKIREFLRAHGMLAPLNTAFLNFSASSCYKIYNSLGKDAKEDLWNMLHSEHSETLGWRNYKKEDFENPEVREFVACVELYGHKEYKKARHIPKFETLRRLLKEKNKREKIKAFFKGMFKKNKDK